MAAKRLGEFLSNVTGTSGQILRVKSDESGFEMFTPATLPAYTITNDTTDRVIDATATTADELANVLSTLIKDLTTVVGGPVAFQWSTDEQVWPFEKASDGSTLYCKEIDCGIIPNNGASLTPTNGISCSKIVEMKGRAVSPSDTNRYLPIPNGNAAASGYFVWMIGLNNAGVDSIYISSNGSYYSSHHAYVRVIYHSLL